MIAKNIQTFGRCSLTNLTFSNNAYFWTNLGSSKYHKNVPAFLGIQWLLHRLRTLSRHRVVWLDKGSQALLRTRSLLNFLSDCIGCFIFAQQQNHAQVPSFFNAETSSPKIWCLIRKPKSLSWLISALPFDLTIVIHPVEDA